MLFPTLAFALFFLLLYPLSWRLAGRDGWRKGGLVAASYLFYGAWDAWFCLLLAGSTLLNHAAAWAIYRQSDPRRRKWTLGGAVAANLAILGYFKYADFFLGSLNELLWGLGLGREIPLLGVIVPVGVSFFTFHGISTLVDLYRGHLAKPAPLLDMLLYISFFPQLVAGPIVRAAHFLPQLQRAPDPRAIPASRALLLIALGLFKKVVIANELGTRLADVTFRDPSLYGALDLWLGLWAYAVQIYCDFSAYSDIAIGIAGLLGYYFPRNFDQPYRSAGPSEFWKRWHISLSSWLRDYLYIPLGGNRGGTWRHYRNLLLTMILGGLWHGANWTFLIWGTIHGLALVGEQALGLRRPWVGWRRALAVLVTFHLVCLAWVFFRSPDLATALAYLAGLVRPGAASLADPFLLALLGLGLIGQFLPPRMMNDLEIRISRWPWALQGLCFGMIVWLIDLLGPRGVAPFIYFQF